MDTTVSPACSRRASTREGSGRRQVEQVVDDELVVRSGAQVAMFAGPTGALLDLTQVGQGGRIGLVRRPHPDPHHAVALRDRVTAHARGLRDGSVAMRIQGAAAAVVESQAVVGALHLVFDDLAPGQRCEAVWAAVVQGGHTAVTAAEQQQRLGEHGDGLGGAVVELFRVGHGVPGVAKKGHVVSWSMSASLHGRDGHRRGALQAITCPSHLNFGSGLRVCGAPGLATSRLPPSRHGPAE
jgi:hypothetical protein